MHPILVRNINHLTDARYFAAMNVDWMSFPLNSNPASFLLWHTLKDWVEGVKLAAEINTQDEMLLAKTIIDAAPDGIITSNHITNEIPLTIQVFHETGSLELVKTELKNSIILYYIPDTLLAGDTLLKIPPDKIFVQSSWTMDSVKALLESGYQGGVCFLGGSEDKTGLRDYRVIDEMLEILG